MSPSPQIVEKSALGSNLLMGDHIQEQSVAVERGLREVPRRTRAKGVSQRGRRPPATAREDTRHRRPPERTRATGHRQRGRAPPATAREDARHRRLPQGLAPQAWRVDLGKVQVWVFQYLNGYPGWEYSLQPCIDKIRILLTSETQKYSQNESVN